MLTVGGPIRYGRYERWKTVAAEHGRTKPHRPLRGSTPELRGAQALRTGASKPSTHAVWFNDGRPPDTAKELLKSTENGHEKGHASEAQAEESSRAYSLLSHGFTLSRPLRVPCGVQIDPASGPTMQQQVASPPTTVLERTRSVGKNSTAKATVTQPSKKSKKSHGSTALFRINPSYKWANNSCWLDTALELLWNAAMQNFNDLRTAFSGLRASELQSTPLYALYRLLDTRRDLYLTNSSNHTVEVLTKQRDDFRKCLHDAKIASLTGFDSVSVSGFMTLYFYKPLIIFNSHGSNKSWDVHKKLKERRSARSTRTSQRML